MAFEKQNQNFLKYIYYTEYMVHIYTLWLWKGYAMSFNHVIEVYHVIIKMSCLVKGDILFFSYEHVLAHLA